MMLEKSKISAFMMGCMYIVTAIISSLLLEAILNPNRGFLDLVYTLDNSNQSLSAVVLSWIALILVIIISGGMLAWFINKLDETHFGVIGALGWMAAGFIFAVWARIVTQVFSHFSEQGASVIEDIALLIGVSVSYGMAFKVLRIRRRIVDTGGPRES